MKENMKGTKGHYHSIKQLVFEYVQKHNGNVNPDNLAVEVLACFPDSAWNISHWSWYRYQFTKGKYKEEFSDFVKGNMKSSSRGRPTEDPRIKKSGDIILKQTRKMINEVANNDEVLKFKVNRWVFARLHQDEIQTKRPIKQKLWNSGIKACQVCSKIFESVKGVEIHRKNSNLPYSIENCELLCRTCHQQKNKNTQIPVQREKHRTKS